MRGRIMVSAGVKPYISVKVLPKQSPVDAINDALIVMKKDLEDTNKGEDKK
jgi:transcription-repair coupling factor (superfamily II helicase)